ncbi:cobalt ABC transporter permease [Salmonella enterica]
MSELVVQIESADQESMTSCVVDHFNLEKFEYHVSRSNVELSARELIFLLTQLDQHYGIWGDKFSYFAPVAYPEGLTQHICTRIAGAVTTLFTRKDFSISNCGYMTLMGYHRWLALIFAVSAYKHGDHIIRTLNAAGGGVVDPVNLNEKNFRLFCLSYYPDSQIMLQPDALWKCDWKSAASLFMALLSGRVLPTKASHSKRELLLQWLPEKLNALDSLEFLPVSVLHDVYMHCSYADFTGKHEIKRSLNSLIRKSLLSQGFKDLVDVSDKNAPGRCHGKKVNKEKPTLLIIVEWFTCQHSVFRTHSRALESLKQYFCVHGVAMEGKVDEITEQVFDKCHKIAPDNAIKTVCDLASELRPEVVFYAGIGMFPFTIYLSNLRLAPLQLVGLGHGASTFCPTIDYFVVEEDFVGSESCFSEQVASVPNDSMPFTPPQNTRRVLPNRIPYLERVKSAVRLNTVRVAVCASIMKINPGFLSVLQEIKQRSTVPVEFCFYMGFSQGLTKSYLEEAIRHVLPDAEVNAHMGIQEYQIALNTCDFFLSPFPYGNMNGVVDAVRQGLPGVCLSGPEIHTHIDEGLFRRLGLPEELIASEPEEYITAAVKLAENHGWRETLQNLLFDQDVEQVLFNGSPSKFSKMINNLYIDHVLVK